MSMRAKLAQAMVKATEIERGRVLWCIDQVTEDLKADLEKKILIETERHLVETKIKIFRVLSQLVKMRIFSGAVPEETEDE